MGFVSHFHYLADPCPVASFSVVSVVSDFGVMFSSLARPDPATVSSTDPDLKIVFSTLAMPDPRRSDFRIASATASSPYLSCSGFGIVFSSLARPLSLPTELIELVGEMEIGFCPL